MLPAKTAEQPMLEDDVAQSAPTTLIKAAAAVLALAGLMTMLTGLQTVMSIRIFGVFSLAPYLQLLLGVGTIALAFYLGRSRAWAALGGLVGSVALVTLNGAWLVFSFANAVFSLFALISAFAPLGAGVLVLLAAADVRRAALARHRLRASGLDLGI